MEFIISKLVDFLSLFLLLLCFHGGSYLGVKLRKTYRISTMFEKVLTFCLARGFDLVLSLGVRKLHFQTQSWALVDLVVL